MKYWTQILAVAALLLTVMVLAPTPVAAQDCMVEANHEAYGRLFTRVECQDEFYVLITDGMPTLNIGWVVFFADVGPAPIGISFGLATQNVIIWVNGQGSFYKLPL